jgi:N-acetylglucosamine kinase-like BadF-type ATPase
MSEQPDTNTVVIGIDGGGSSTRAALADSSGTVLGMGESGASNYQAVGIEGASESIRQAVEQAWRQSGMEPRRAAAAFLGMAGVVSETDRNVIGGIASALDLAPADRIGIDHDLRTALAGGLGGRQGIVLIVGTGSSCYGRRDDGVSWRAGGWGHLLDDVGSGYWLGLQGLIAVARAIDGRGGATSLTESLLATLKITDVQELLRTVHSVLTRAEIAALAPQVVQAADNGDHVAFEILRLGTEELARMVQAVAQQLGWISDSVECAIVGGLTGSDAYLAEIVSTIGKRAPNVQVVEPMLPPVLGGVVLGMEMLGWNPLTLTLSQGERG